MEKLTCELLKLYNSISDEDIVFHFGVEFCTTHGLSYFYEVGDTFKNGMQSDTETLNELCGILRNMVECHLMFKNIELEYNELIGD